MSSCVRSMVLAGFLIACAEAGWAGQAAYSIRPASARGAVLFDASRGPTLWACGANYKAGFDADGAQFVPFLGSQAPRNYPIGFALVEARAGGAPLELERRVQPVREGSSIVFDRGGAIELYRLEPESLEQLFRIDAPPRDGDLVLRIRCETELDAFADAGGIRFQGEHGGARYGQAIVFDARGSRADVPVAWVDGAIELRVHAEFLATARAPITIDPLVTTLAIDLTPARDTHPDVAYDASLDVYVTCWERFFSGWDRDICGAILDASGNVLEEFLIDSGPVPVGSPEIAGMEALDRFLIATIQTTPPVAAEVRLLDLSGGTLSVGAPHVLLSNNATDIDVGGDAGPAPSNRFCAAASFNNGGCRAVVLKVFDEDGMPVGTGYQFGDCDYNFTEPRLSKSTLLGELGERSWHVAFQLLDPGSTYRLKCYRVKPDETVDHEVVVSIHDDDRVQAVSSSLEGALGEEAHLVVWKRLHGSGSAQLFARAVRGTELGPVIQIHTGDPGVECVDAEADSDGSSFIVTYTARHVPNIDERVYAETYALEDLELVLTERTQLSTAGERDGASAITSTRSGGGASQRCFVVWHEILTPGDGDIEGALYDTPGPGRRYCTAAPNSAGPGATLHAAGSISIQLDQFELRAQGCPPNRPGIFYLGQNPTELPFGDGFRCIGGDTRRITPIVTTDSTGTVSLLLDFDQPYGDLVHPGPPGIHYQFWYRDSNGGPADFNLSDALHVEHAP